MKFRHFGRALYLFRYFFLAYPVRSVLMLTSMLLAASAEGLGIAALLPLMDLALAGGESQGVIGRFAEDAFGVLGLEPSIGGMLVAIVVLMTLKSLLTLLAMAQVGYTAAHAAMDLRLHLLRTLMDARWEHFVEQRAGYLASAIGGEPGRAATAYLSACRVLAALIQIGIYATLSVAISWQVTVAAFAVGGLSMALLNKFVRISGRAGEDQTKVQRSFMSRLLDGLNGMKPLKAMACEDRLTPLLESDVRSLNEVQRALILSRESLAQLREPLKVVALAVGLYFLLQVWEARLESLLVLAVLFVRTVQRIGNLQKFYQQIVQNQPAFWFLRSTIERAEAAREVAAGGSAPGLAEAITLKNVDFSYGPKSVLRDVSLSIPVGRFISVVGPSGAGKTTIADLIIGLLRPQSGEVWIDEVPMAEIDMRSWRSMIGYVPQETFLFHDTILTNITLGDDALSHRDVEGALRRADAWDFVAALPQGMETVVGERGAKLSGGQRQRIAIARALVRDPVLLILDEATTALDPKTEAAICATLQHLAGDVTILAISHQPAMVEAADLVYRVDQGTVTTVKELAEPLRAVGSPG
jgi:ATP-binding cassette subfamily C protein